MRPTRTCGRAALTIVIASLIISVAVVAAVAWVSHRDRGGYQPPPMPDGWGNHPDDQRWNTEAVEASHTALKDVRSAAQSWSGSIAGFLGAFGLVAFVKGPEALSDVEDATAAIIIGAVVVAALATSAAVLLAALASQGSPRRVSRLDGWTLKTWHRRRAKTAAGQLRASRLLAVGAALVVLVATALTWISELGEDETADEHVIAVLTDGTITCGKLGDSAAGITVDGRRLAGVTHVQPVDTCPSPHRADRTRDERRLGTPLSLSPARQGHLEPRERRRRQPLARSRS